MHEPDRPDDRRGARRVAGRQFTARELTEAHLAAIEALNPRLNAFITVTGERALAQADAADAALARGEFAPLTGIPLAIKDLFCTEGVRTTAGSRILEPFIPPYESTVSANLLRDGAVFLGKANMDEFAMGSSNMTIGLWRGGRTRGSGGRTDRRCWCLVVRRAVRRQRCRRGWRWARRAPIPAARSVSLRRSAASSG